MISMRKQIEDARRGIPIPPRQLPGLDDLMAGILRHVKKSGANGLLTTDIFERYGSSNHSGNKARIQYALRKLFENGAATRVYERNGDSKAFRYVAKEHVA